MITSGSQNMMLLFSLLLLVNVLAAVYQAPRQQRYPYVVNNQRSADGAYRYAWFTRDLHDQPNTDDASHGSEQAPSAQNIDRLKLLKSLLNRQYLKNEEALAQFNEER